MYKNFWSGTYLTRFPVCNKQCNCQHRNHSRTGRCCWQMWRLHWLSALHNWFQHHLLLLLLYYDEDYIIYLITDIDMIVCIFKFINKKRRNRRKIHVIICQIQYSSWVGSKVAAVGESNSANPWIGIARVLCLGWWMPWEMKSVSRWNKAETTQKR